MKTENYKNLIAKKSLTVSPVGFPNPPDLNPLLFDFQIAATRWALRRGRSCLFLDTGLGKTWCAIEWARIVAAHTGKPVLILTPLSVTRQFVSEGKKLGVEITNCREPGDEGPGVNVTNYERIEKFDCEKFGGVVLDESSILKNFTGKTRNLLIDRFKACRFKLCTTATPAPNDQTELGNHCEFIGVMTRSEMLAMFFVHDGGSTADWYIKGHAKKDFWAWVCSWALMVKSPEDLGFDGKRYVLPNLTIEQVTVESGQSSTDKGMLLGYQARNLSEQREARRKSLASRVAKAAELANNSGESWLVWCELNDESKALADSIPDAVEVRGSDSHDHKDRCVWDFIDGRSRVLVTKPSICGMGLNMQICSNVIFVGLGYSWELYYQAIRRVWRFGQTKPVNVHVVTSDVEGRVVDAITRKQADADEMSRETVGYMRETMRAEIMALDVTRDSYDPKQKMRIAEWLM